MTLFIEQDYAERAMSLLLLYKKNIGKFSLSSRCPICGDSKTNPHATRFKAYEYKGKIRLGCFRCGYNQPLYIYLKDERPDLYRQYIVDIFKPVKPEKRQENIEYTLTESAVLPYIEEKEIPFGIRLDKLPENHPIILYVKDRMIPVDKYNRMFFTLDWPSVANSIKADSYPVGCKKEARLVIPIYNKDGKVESAQGRSLNPKAKSKYITIKHTEESTKIYGSDLIDENEDVFVMEGAVDTFFIPNSIAITGGQMSIDEIPYKNAVFVLDNENRHEHTMKRYLYYINQGCRVVLWDRSPWKQSDVNDMIKNEGATAEEITEYFKKNIVQGQMAELRFNKWKKI